jgi:putative hydrolase of the HAD superfamily
VIPTLERLAKSSRLAVISNFDGRLRGILSGLGLAGYFEHVFISSEVGADKPHREIFQHALATMDVPATACWHVGDDPIRDWAGAQAAGIASFELKRPETTLNDIPA